MKEKTHGPAKRTDKSIEKLIKLPMWLAVEVWLGTEKDQVLLQLV
jgi:hypothetical protein